MTVSLEQFLKRLTDTGVKSEQDLRACLEKIPLSEWPGDCQQFAKLLVREKFITADQAQKALAEATEATPDLTT
ncbi:MAG: Serine/threonine protein kinaserelated protein, partial [Planctomycetaceae bacterium]|nr:Serine/threonine protein kinaserelated protein [Planctomycetaceae bacterium]